MKAKRFLPLLIFGLALTSCRLSFKPDYVEMEVSIYRKVGQADKKIMLRFYEETPNVPYINVKNYFKEFFNTDIYVAASNDYYAYMLARNNYIAFDTTNDLLYSSGIQAFNYHPDFASSTSQLFIKLDSIETTSQSENVINLKNYSIDLRSDGNNAYVPISLLGKLTGGLSLYNIAYNENDLYVIDRSGLLGEALSTASYGASYYKTIGDMNSKRSEDLAKYTYNELCFVFDHLRGFTSQLVFGDNNLLSLGLNGLLEKYNPKIKAYLLSNDREDYLEGLGALFAGLYDGGHTGVFDFSALANARSRNSEEEFVALKEEVLSRNKSSVQANAVAARLSKLGSDANDKVYKYDSASKTAYIVFNSFDVDYSGWDNYYKNGGNVPVETDTYAFVRSKLYQAKSDGAENVVLDISANGGGNSYALEGIVGLLNGAVSKFNTNDVFNKYREVDTYLIDINLDGQFNEQDVLEAQQFNFNIGVLTSAYSFSCANLLPSVLKGLGYKIIGEQSGGGSCAIAISSTADGIEFVHSSYICLSDDAGTNIDAGVKVDFEIEHPYNPELGCIDYRQFYDYETVGNYLSSAYL